MGNCLDNPAPPPRGRVAYMTRPRYFVVRRGLPVTSAAMPRYPSYQPYTMFRGFRPSMTHQPVIEPAYSYGFDSASSTSAYYADSDYDTHPSLDYDEQVSSGGSMYRRHRRTRDKRSRYGDSVEGISRRLSGDTTATQNGVICVATLTNNESTRIPKSAVMTEASISSQNDREVTVEHNSASNSRHEQSIEAASGTPDVIQSDAGLAPIRKTASSSDSVTGEINIYDSLEANDTINQVQQVQDILGPGVSDTINHVQQVQVMPEASDTINQVQQMHDIPEEDEVIAFLQSVAAWEDSTGQSLQDDSHTLAHREDTSVFAPSKKISFSKRSTYGTCDVAICHHSADRNVMLKIKHTLENLGVSVSVSYPDGFVDWLMFPQTIVDANIMVVLLSHNSVRDKRIADEVCLAHATGTIVYPVTLEKSLDLDSVMDACLKLQLSCYKWTQLADDDNPDVAIGLMTRRVKEDLLSLERTDSVVQGRVSHGARVGSRISQHHQSQPKKVKYRDHVTAVQYWEELYGKETSSVPWNRFYQNLYKSYRNQWKDVIPQTSVHSLRESLKHEIEADADDTVHEDRFLAFCRSVDIDQDVWDRIHCLSIEVQSVTNVLHAKSSVRIVAIENIAKFSSKSTLSALRTLLTDTDPSIRAIAVMSMSRSMVEADEATVTALLATLDDKNELVRQTGCLAFACLRSRAATDKLQSLWRNDDVSQVRDAAAEALNEIERI